MDSPSILALVFTLLLALCSALAFVLIYMRSPWSRHGTTPAAGHLLDLRGGGHTSRQGLQAAFNKMHHAHSGGTIQVDSSQGALAHALGPSPILPPSASSSSSSVSQQPGAPLTAADLALRGRKAKKRGGRVHVTVAPSQVPSAASGTGRSRATSSAQAHAPYVYPLEFLAAAPPVIVCLTTIPSRVHHIDKCLNSIKTQNYPIAQMMLAIPEECRREHTKYSIPDRVRKDAIISVVRVSHDYGPSTSLITAWSAIPAASQHKDTLIITLEDDQIYHPDTVATLVRHALQYPDSAVGFAGYSLRGPPYIQPNLSYVRPRDERPELAWKASQQHLQQQLAYAAAQAQNEASRSAALAHAAAHIDPTLLPPFDPLPDTLPAADPYAAPLPNPNDVYETERVDVLCGWRGVCFRKRHLDEKLWREYSEVQSEAAYWANDEWISAQLAKNGIQRRVILAPFDSVLSRLRLRHGRNSSTASHLAHQQTILEHVQLQSEGKLFGPQTATTMMEKKQNGTTNNHTTTTTNGIQTGFHPPTEADLVRLKQLIRPFQPETETSSKGDGTDQPSQERPATIVSPASDMD